MESNDWNFKYYGEYDVSSLQKKILEHTREDWLEFDWRQNAGPRTAHKRTFSIPVQYDPKYYQRDGEKTKWWDKYKDEYYQIQEHLGKEVGLGKIIRFIFVNLPAGEFVPPHQDGYTQNWLDPELKARNIQPSLKTANRITIPVFSNDKVVFDVRGEKIIQTEGKVVEINQYGNLHSVKNGGETDRIVILLDYTTFPKKNLLI